LKNGLYEASWKEYNAWAETGGSPSELKLFANTYFISLCNYYFDKGEFIRVETVLKTIEDAALRSKLAEKLSRLKTAVTNLEEQAEGYVKKEDYSQALRIYRSLYTALPDAADRYRSEFGKASQNYCDALLEKGDYSSAGSVLESAFSFDPSLFNLLKNQWAQLKITMIKNGKMSPVIMKAVDSLADVACEDDDVLKLAGEVFLKSGDLEKAYNYFAEVCGKKVWVSPGKPNQSQVEVLQNRSQAEVLRSFRIIQDPDSGIFGYVQGPFTVTASDYDSVKHSAAVLDHFYRKIVSAVKSSELIPLDSMNASFILHADKKTYTEYAGNTNGQGVTNMFVLGGELQEVTVQSYVGAENLYLTVLPHELGHVLLAFGSGDTGVLPLCLQEGFAVYMEPLFKKKYTKQ